MITSMLEKLFPWNVGILLQVFEYLRPKGVETFHNDKVLRI